MPALASTALIAPFLALAPAQAEVTYEQLPSSSLRVVDVDSEMPENPAEHAIDGDPATIWHTPSQPEKAPLPHHLTVSLGAEEIPVGRVHLTPRSTSGGSGRIGEYELATSTDAECAPDTFTTQATGEFDGLVANRAEVRTITLESPVTARCVRITYLSSWGGAQAGQAQSPAEQVASLAELRVDRAVESADGTQDPSAPSAPDPGVDIADAPRIGSGPLSVSVHPRFPQILQYRMGGKTLEGNPGAPLTEVLIDEQPYAVTVGQPEITADRAAYQLTFPDLPEVSMTAVVQVQEDTLTWSLTDIVDPNDQVHSVQVPGLSVVSAHSTSPGAMIVASDLSVNRGVSGDTFYPLDEQPADADSEDPAFLALATNGALAAGFETNAVIDNTVVGATSDNARFITSLAAEGDGVRGAVSPGSFVVKGSTADLGLGPDPDPFIRVRITADANADEVVDWQDAAVAAREIRTAINGADEVPDDVIKRIPFNIVSQATHPFLRTLDDTKRVSLATDGLGQSVMLKGYQAEGHDSAHPDYAGHYNTRAGGKKDFDTLVQEGEAWNATFGVHVNATESYSEAHAFSEELLRDPIQPGWDWMNQSYYIDGPKDLGSKAILERFQDFRDETDPNLSFLYMDVYYPSGWEGQRLSAELQEQGWVVSTEWADKFPLYSTWSHWANDEKYGGSSNKGVNSQVIRFVNNADRDIWNPDPLLSNANIQEFEGWTGKSDANAFFDNVWQRNLPTKFLQQGDIMQWQRAGEGTEGRIVLSNGTVVTSPVTEVSGTEIPTQRTITYDGATVYEGGAYLLPWDDGAQRLYHYNPDGGTTTWTLTDQWAGQSSLTAYRLTDQGRVEPTEVPVQDGTVTLDAEPGQPYVLYPSSDLPEVQQPQWGEGTPVADPGFFSGGLDAWNPEGQARVETDQDRNALAVLGASPAALWQQLRDPDDPGAPLPAGSYSAWAWIEIDPTATREVEVSVEGAGVAPTAHQEGGEGRAATAVTSSTAINATASDTKNGRYFQRVRVTFTSTGEPVTLRIAAGEGDAEVRVDDVRVVPFTAPQDPAPTEQTVLFEDFEHVDTGYGPFVTGRANIGGDARTQLAELHEPYSQAGWYGRNASGEVVEGGKLTDNVLRGHWSLMSNEERNGLILRSTSATIPFEAGHRYRVSVDHQTAYEGTYSMIVGRDALGEEVTETELERVPFPQARGTTATLTHEFVADACAAEMFIGVVKHGGGTQANLTLDDLRVEDLGVAEEQTACASLEAAPTGPLRAGQPTEVVTTLTNEESTPITDVEHQLAVPEGWQVSLAEDSAVDAGPIAPGETSAVRWSVTSTDEAPSGEVTATAAYTVAGEPRRVSVTEQLTGSRSNEMFLSDLQDRVVGEPTNGWGPVEWDMSNGSNGAEDGGRLSIADQEFGKGIGVHANSSVSFDISGLEATEFSAVLGVDDEIGTRGSVVFRVLGDDGEVLDGPTEVMRGGQEGVPITVDVTGVSTLTLVTEDGGDGNGADHGDWAMARLITPTGETDEPTPEDPEDPQEPTPTEPSPEEPSDPGRPDKPGNPEAPGKPENPGRPENPGKRDNPGRADAPGRPDDPGRPDNPGRPDDPGRPDNPGRPDDAGQRAALGAQR